MLRAVMGLKSLNLGYSGATEFRVTQTIASYLINVQHIRPSVPSPIPRNCPKLALRKLNDFAGTIFCEEAEHGARAWPAVQPYRKLIGRISSSNKPKEGVGWIRSGYVNPSGVLLLRVEDCFAAARPWRLVRDGDISIDGGRDGR
jgi:hypothetical protein